MHERFDISHSIVLAALLGGGTGLSMHVHASWLAALAKMIHVPARREC